MITWDDPRMGEVESLIQIGVPVSRACEKVGLNRMTYYSRLRKEKTAVSPTTGNTAASQTDPEALPLDDSTASGASGRVAPTTKES